MRFKAICLIIGSWLTVNNCLALEICGDIKQGELILLKSARNVVFYDNTQIADFVATEQNIKSKTECMVASDGQALLALQRNAAKKSLIADYPGTDYGTIYEIDIAPSKWDIQHIKGVAQHKVTPDKRHEKEISRELNDVRKALSKESFEEFWREGFTMPVNGRISGNFGNQRIYNGIPKNPHSGTDIAAPEGTPVKASGSGKVVLSGKNYFYTGNMVIISHGQSLYTIYAHLKEATVKDGDIVKKGDIIGYVGKTGRATGAHLHWGAVAGGVRFRPQSLLDINEKKCRHFDGIYIGSLVED